MSAARYFPVNPQWRRSLAELALTCAGSFRADEADRLRDLCALLRAEPAFASQCGLAVPDKARLDGLLASDAPESAALALIGERAGYLLSCGAGGQYLASVALADASDDVTAGGDTLALALVGAVALALSEHVDGTVSVQGKGAPAGARLN